MMDVISPCMTWVSILWGQLRGLFIKNGAVDNPVHDLQAVDDPLPDLPTVDNPVHDLQAVDDPLPTVDNPLSHLPRVDDHLPDLPYHIITDILSRLPAKCVFQCQRVSRQLNVLATTPFFIHTHLNRATSVTALHSITQSSDRDIKLYFIEEESEKIEVTSLKLDFCYMRKNEPIMLFGSYNGFLQFRNQSYFRPFFFICNPITKQQVTVTTPCSDMYVCGFYFHPLKREYEMLYLYEDGAQFEFHIVSLGTKSWRNIGNYSYPPSFDRPPIIINGTLYWMVNSFLYHYGNRVYPSCSGSILSFKIETQEFSTMQHGGPLCGSPYTHKYMQLLEIEGQLGLCEPTISNTTTLVLWVLNHRTKWWDKRHIVTLPMYVMPRYVSAWPNVFNVEVLKIKNGELLLRQENRLLVYNLHLSTYRIVQKKGFEDDNFRAMIHTHSIVSLDTDSVISLRR
ncbi:F-box domain [Macleaya cordata]|uniref:F-box domain n=1 Tax=Macleaya cordata TaxID=56857 RepID=A0A200QCQ8_MACCD|nr:F-box domain [Macleaya cordata]